MRYTNPIIPGFHPDPSICRAGEDYYLVTSSFEYFPGGLGPEGPHVYKINGTYYLMIAEGGTEFGHMETVARGPSASGPWESCPRNPILTHRSSGSPIQATGHADLVQTPGGHWFMVCLGIRPFGYHRVHVLGRETFLAPVTWDADGWPRVGDGRMIALEMESDHLPAPCPWPVRPVRDDFDQPVLGVEWNFIRNPIVERYSLTERPGWLTLYGGPASLDRMEWPTFAGRRQEQLQSCASTLLDFASVADGEEAGLTVFQNYDHHYEIAVVRRDGANQLICRRRIGDLAAETASMSAPANPLHLRIRAEKDAYCLEYGVDGTTYHCMDKGRMRYLSTEVGGRFTGVYFGLYATGNGKESSTPARFDWFTDRVSE